MTPIAVVWCGTAPHDPDSFSREFWDCALIGGLFDGSVWRPPAALTFVHTVSFADVPAGEGAVVCFPARYYVEYADWLNAQTAALPWVLYVGTGDEAAEFDYARLTHPRRKVYGMGATPERCAGVDRPLGSGWPPSIRDVLRATSVHKSYSWWFAGQITHKRRQQFVEAARHPRMPDDGDLLGTEGFTEGVPQRTYWKGLAAAKIAPCPSGPESCDSFRLYEALEAGCVPIADACTPHGCQDDYWTYVFDGAPPFPQIKDWSELPEIARQVLDGWPANAARVHAWWVGKKRGLAYALHDDVRTLADLPVGRPTPDDEITVLIPTSPIPSHPDTSIIAQTIDSIRERLPYAEIIVVADGVRPEQGERRADYDEYLRRLVWRCNLDWPNVLPVIRDEWGHQSNCFRTALEHVTTPYCLLVEHDTPLVGPQIDWPGCLRAIASGAVNAIRFHHEAHIPESHEHLMLDAEPVDVCGVPLLRTAQFSARPHLAPAWWYRDVLDRYCGRESRVFVEDALYPVVCADWTRDSEVGWQRWRLAIYAPEGTLAYSMHTDGRAGDPKFGQTVAYDGGRPFGALPEGERDS